MKYYVQNGNFTGEDLKLGCEATNAWAGDGG